MTGVKGFLYRYTGADPGTGAKLSSVLNLTSWDSNETLTLYPIKRGAATSYSYIAALAYYFESDPGVCSTVSIWPSLVGGSLDAQVTIKIATTLQTTYKRATGTLLQSGTPIAALYTGVTTEDFFNYTSEVPKVISGSDMLKTSGTGQYTKFILIQAEISPTAALAAIPVSPIQLKISHAAGESS